MNTIGFLEDCRRKIKYGDENLMRPFPLLGILATSTLLILSFPRPDAGIVSLVALVPLLITASGLKPSRAFLAGWSAGLIWFFISYNWVAYSISNYGGIPFPLDRAIIMLLAGVHALYTGCFGAVLPRWRRMTGLQSLLFLPSTWILLEMARSWFPAPFPWLLLGSSLWRTPPLRPLYSLMGVYGVSFYIVVVNGILCLLLTGRRTGKKALAIVVGALALLPALGAVTSVTAPSELLKVGIVQGSIDQELKWKKDLREETVRLYLHLTDKAVGQGAELIVWPETAVPYNFKAGLEVAKTLKRYVKDNGIHLIFGSRGYELLDGQYYLFNRAYHFAPEGRGEHYDKVQLVPFGEYVPFSGLIPFIERMVPGEGEFTRGRWRGPFDTPIRTGPLICYEVSFPSLARKEVRDGSRILVNMTNDAWFGRSWGPYQHLAVASVRAAENGVPVIRAANTGISAVIDRNGTVVRRIPLQSRDIMVAEIQTGGYQTIYTRFGDWIVILAVAVITMIIHDDILAWRLKKWKGSRHSGTP